MFDKKKCLFCLVLGCLSGLGFAPLNYVWLFFITYSLFFYLWMESTKKLDLFLMPFGFGFGIGAISMSWLINALLINPAAYAFIIPLVPLGFGFMFGMYFAIPALLCWKIKNVSARILTYAGLFVIFEWIRGWIFTGFPWNLTGSVWTACLPVLQMASVVGVYGLSLFSVIWFATPYLIYKRKYYFALFNAITFIAVALLGALRLYEMKPEYVWGVNLRLVQPNIEQALKWKENTAEEIFMKHIRLSKSEGYEKITHVLWAETASPFLLNVDEKARAMTMSAVVQNGTLIAGSLRAADVKKRQLANSIFVLDDLGEIVAFYDKSHLVPFGEYMPLRGWLPFEKLVPISSDFAHGDGVKTLAIPNAPPAGMLVCYEVIFPHQVVDRKYRPSWLINTTNDAWYGVSAGPHQHLAAAQMRAAEEGLPIVRVAGTGISAIIYPWGEIMSALPLDTKGVLDGPLPKELNETVYARLGNSIALILSLSFIILGVTMNKKKKLLKLKG